MKRSKKIFTLKNLLVLLIVLIIFNMCFNLIKNTIRKSNIYTIKSYENVDVKVDAKAYFVFDEHVFNNFDQNQLKINGDNLFRDREKISETISIDASSKANDLIVFLNKVSKADYDASIPNVNSIINDIYNEKYSNLNFNYTDSINEKNKYLDQEKAFYESYLENKAIVSDKTGYYINKLDGYEGYINQVNMDNFTGDIFNINSKAKNEPILGLKYLNSKSYNVLLKIDDFEKYKDVNFSNLKVKYDVKEYLVSDFKIIKDSKGQSFINLYMNEGLSEAKNYRFKDVSLSFNQLKMLKVPSGSILDNDGQRGVYCVDSGKIVFSPVKEIYKNSGYTYVYTKKEDVFPRAKLELIEKNNSNLSYDAKDKNYINISEIGEFSEILINPDKAKIGDNYEY